MSTSRPESVREAIFRGCWNCLSRRIISRPDQAMQGITDEIVCLDCGEIQ